MATRGRKPLPTALKELEGDRGKGRRPLNKDEPTPPQNNVKCPDWLMPEAKKEFIVFHLTWFSTVFSVRTVYLLLFFSIPIPNICCIPSSTNFDNISILLKTAQRSFHSLLANIGT